MSKSDTISELLELVAQYNRHMYIYGKNYRQYGTEHRLRQDQIHLIDLIGRHPCCNLTYLAEVGETEIPTMSLQIERLRKMGLVNKKRSENSQRELEVTLTEAGMQAFQFHWELDENWSKSTTQLLQSYTEEQLLAIRHFLSDLLCTIQRQQDAPVANP